MQLAVRQNPVLRFGIVLVAIIETLIWLANSPWILGLALFGFGGSLEQKNPIGLLVIVPLLAIPILSVSALVLGLKNTRLGLAAALAGVAAALFVVL